MALNSSRYRREILLLGGVPIAVALLALTGWLSGIRLLTSIRSDYFPMPPSTCLGLILTTLSLLAISFLARKKYVLLAARLVSISMLSFALIILNEFAAGISPGMEERVFGIAGELNGIPVGRMSPIASALFLLSNCAILAFSLKRNFSGPLRKASAVVGLVVFFIGAITTVGYLYGTPLLYGGTTRPVAPNAGFAFFFLAAGIIFAAGPDVWPLRHFVGPRVQPRLLRTFLPIVVLLILVDGFLIAVIPDFFEVNLVYLSTILAILSLAPATLLISRSARRIGGDIDRANAERDRAEARLQEALEELRRSNVDLGRSNAELERSNEELERFAYVASHDLQEPLRMVSSFADLVQSRYSDALDEDGRDFIGYVTEGSQRMKILIDDLLMLSRVGKGGKPFEQISMEEALRAAETNLKLAIRDAQATIIHESLPAVEGDFSQMVQLFQNLLENAIKFRAEAPPRIHVSAKKNDSEVEFCVADNSVGFEQRFAERIFMIFQRLQGPEERQGTGIGLAIVKKIVERHHGRVWARSEPGSGSTFCFTIPREPKETPGR